MTPYETLGLLLTIAALFAYVNHRWIRLPATIGLMAIALALSVILIALDRAGVAQLAPLAHGILDRIALDRTLLHGMLGALLFAGALHVDLNDLREQKLPIAILALGGTLLSTFVVAALVQLALAGLGVPLPFLHCLLFGSLISPTDPIAVLDILKRAKIPRALEIQIAGESLFNDGIAVVVFLTIAGMIDGSGRAAASDIAILFLREAVGGAIFGLAIGYLAYRLIRSIDHYQTELLITLALVVAGYAAAERLHVSAPIAAVVSGLLIGNHGRALGMSEVTRENLDRFWSLIDEILNAILFVLVGFELIRVHFAGGTLAAGLCAVGIVLFARALSVSVPVAVLSRIRPLPRGSLAILTWGGLRGGVSVALALSIPTSDGARSLIVGMTWVVVVFSILAQGLTLARVARRFSMV